MCLINSVVLNKHPQLCPVVICMNEIYEDKEIKHLVLAHTSTEGVILCTTLLLVQILNTRNITAYYTYHHFRGLNNSYLE